MNKSYGEPGVPLQAPKFAPEETFSWWVYQHQEPLIIPKLDEETRFPAVAEMLEEPRGSLGMLASLDDSTPAPRGPCCWQLRGGRLQYGRSQLPLARRQPSGAGSGQRNELRRVTTCHGGIARERKGFRLIVDSIPGICWYTRTEGESNSSISDP